MKNPFNFRCVLDAKRFTRAIVCAALCLFVVPSVFAALPHTLRSPWDGHAVTPTKAAYSCPALAYLAPDLKTAGFYRLDDPTHSIVDPARMKAYRASADGVKSVGEAIVRAADRYRTTGSLQAAQCATSHILTLAHDKSLTGRMSSGQAFYVQGWVVGAIAIADLKVRDAGFATPQQQALINAWLLRVGDSTKGFYDQHAVRHPNGNNHLYWAGVELAAIGVVANNRRDFEWAVDTYDNGVDQIRPDGTLPLEMARGARALHYHLYAIAPLVLLAEFGEANGLDLYARDHGAIHHLIDVSIAGLHNPSLFVKETGIQQEVPSVISGDAIGWAPPYVHRFPNAALSRLIDHAPSLSVYYLGGLPPPE